MPFREVLTWMLPEVFPPGRDTSMSMPLEFLNVTAAMNPRRESSPATRYSPATPTKIVLSSLSFVFMRESIKRIRKTYGPTPRGLLLYSPSTEMRLNSSCDNLSPSYHSQTAPVLVSTKKMWSASAECSISRPFGSARRVASVSAIS